MLKVILGLFLSGCLMPGMIYAQYIDNTASYRDVDGEKYYRMNYENDFFTGTDQYYTQGYSLEWVSPGLKKNPLTRVLIRLNDNSKYGLSFEHYGLTPTSIESDEILYGDRPFSACIMLKTFSISTDTIRKIRFSSLLSTGLIGRAALGEEIQRDIHRFIGRKDPRGWQYQIGNDIILNYEINYEKLIYDSKLFSVNTHSQLRIGTLSDKIQAGLTFTAGKLRTAFHGNQTTRGRKLNVQFYAQPLINFIAYDATLQGGVFHKNSPYTLKNDEIERITLQGNFGAIFRHRRIYFEYIQSMLGKEFETGKPHQWGGVRFGLMI
ncbi:MAG TPA: lipid A deacylase LpxR family protein [Sphingobacteriaceae bacterium]|nr:lipid A deacylase LpxR family protein [Sphingobacteriaceae bacterium]